MVSKIEKERVRFSLRYAVYDRDNRLVLVNHETRTAGDLTYTTGGLSQLIDFYGYDVLGQRVRHSDNVYATWDSANLKWVPTVQQIARLLQLNLFMRRSLLELLNGETRPPAQSSRQMALAL